jgi:hypothetical protein
MGGRTRPGRNSHAQPPRHAKPHYRGEGAARLGSASPSAIERMLAQYKATVAAEFARALLGTMCTSGRHRAGSSNLCGQCSQARAGAEVARQLGGIV